MYLYLEKLGNWEEPEMKKLFIVTGPPGSGKTTYSKILSQNYEAKVYDTDLDNKQGWRQDLNDSILNTAAPSRENKDYWEQEAIRNGFQPEIMVMWVPRVQAMTNMRKRSGQHKTQRNDLNRSVERWYRLYTAHPREVRVNVPPHS